MMVSRILVFGNSDSGSSIGIISLIRLEQKEVANTQQLRTTLLRQLSRTDHLRLFVAALGAIADLSAHSYSQLVVPSHCLCTYLPTMHLLCGLIVRQIGTLVLLLPDKSRCTYLTSILPYHMLRVVKSISFCNIG